MNRSRNTPPIRVGRTPGTRGAARRATQPSSWRPTPRAGNAAAERAAIAEARARSGWVFTGVVLFLVALAIKASYVMVIPDERLEERGRRQYQAAEERRGQRGDLLDRNGRVLASTVRLPSLYANPTKWKPEDLEQRIAAIAAVTGRSETWIRERFAARNEAGRALQEVRLGESLEPEAVAAITAGMSREQVWVRQEPVRFYPGKDRGAPLVGFTDALGDGAAGVEKVLEPDLGGEAYRVLVARDAQGNSVRLGADESRLARAGNSVRLTIDAAIQHATERALLKAVEASAPEAAMAVAIDVRTGAVLAMANWPSGNPNDGVARAQQKLFSNRAAMDQIEPGSVVKPFVVAAAMEEGITTPDSMIDCELGSWGVGGKTIRDDHPKGVISLTDVIKFSSNIGTAKIGMQLGAEKVIKYLQAFGFGRSTGLGLPGEVPGALRSADTIKTIELATTSFGQGMTASPVQLAAAMAAIANDGVRMQPYLVDAVLEGSDRVPMPREPRVDRSVLSEGTARAISRMMETVIEEGGTGTRAAVPGYRVAGKTGTAQKAENGGYSATARIGSFVGFLPADRPEIAISVSIDTPTIGSKYGGIVAAPAFSEIGAFTMRYLGVEPDPPTVLAPDPADPTRSIRVPAPERPPEPAPEARAPIEIGADGNGGWILPDLVGHSMRDAMASLQPTGVALRLEGYGRVTAQSPAPGTRIAPGERVVLRLQ